MAEEHDHGQSSGQPIESSGEPEVFEVSADARELRAAPEEARMIDRGSDLDPAHRALSDALHLSFRIVQGVMVLLIIGFLLTGFRSVQEQEQGIRLTFGKMQSGEPLKPGFHASWPAPLGDFIHVPTAPRTINLDDAFWLKISDADKGKPYEMLAPMPRQGLVPGDDGSIITADHNIAHTKWSVVYRIRDPRTFVQNISESERIEQVGSEADQLVRRAIERGVVHASAETDLDDVISNKDALEARVKVKAQQSLDRIGCGIEIQTVSCKESRPPRAIYESYRAVNNASSEANQKIESAREQATQTLNGVAGLAHRKIAIMIRIYEALTENVEPEQDDLDQLCRMVDNPDEVLAASTNPEQFLELIDELLVSPEVGGEVSSIIADARQYSTRLVSKLDSETQALEAYYADYRESPLLFMRTLWNEAMKTVMSDKIERFILSPDTDRYELRFNRDPRIRKRLQQESYSNEQQQAQSQGEGP